MEAAHSSNYYSLLGVSATASEEEVLRAWRRRMADCHPDKAGSQAEEMAKLLNRAKTVLCDRLERQRFDESRDEAGDDEECQTNLLRLTTSRTLSKDLLAKMDAWRKKSEKSQGAEIDTGGFRGRFVAETQSVINQVQRKLGVNSKVQGPPQSSPIFFESLISDDKEEDADSKILTAESNWTREVLEVSLTRSTKTNSFVAKEGQQVCCYDLSCIRDEELHQLSVILLPPGNDGQALGINRDRTEIQQKLEQVLPKFQVDRSKEKEGWKRLFTAAICVVCGASDNIADRKCSLVSGACRKLRPVCASCANLEARKRLHEWERLARESRNGSGAALIAEGIVGAENIMLSLRMDDPASVIEVSHDASMSTATALLLVTQAQIQQTDDREGRLKSRQDELILKLITEETDEKQKLRLLLLLQDRGRLTSQVQRELRPFLVVEEARLKRLIDSADINAAFNIAVSQIAADRLLLHLASHSSSLSSESLAKAQLPSRIVGLFLRGAGILSCASSANSHLEGMRDLTQSVLEGHSTFFNTNLIPVAIDLICQCVSHSGTLPVHALLELVRDPWSDCSGLFARHKAASTKPASQPLLFPGICIAGHSLKAIRKCEAALAKGLSKARMTPLQAAMSALDLVLACESLPEICACILECLALLMQALETEESPSQRFSLKEAMFEVGTGAVSLCLNSFADGSLLNYVARHCFALMREAARSAGCPNDAERLALILEIAAFSGRLSPFVALPMVRPSESLVMSKLLRECGQHLLCGLSQPENLTKLQLPSSAIAYQSLECGISGFEFDESECRQLELTAASEMLRERGLDFGNVAAILNPSYLNVPPDGWLKPKMKLNFEGCGNTFGRIDKIIVNKQTYEINVSGERGNLVSDFDVLTGLLLDQPGVAFSLNQPTKLHEARFHPFQDVWSTEPKHLKGTPFMDTLFNTDYLMKQFSAGYEICRKPPFDRRPLLAGQGLFDGLPDHLRQLLRPLSERGEHRARCSRFWITATDMEMKIEETSDTIEFVFGSVRMEVKTHTMITTMSGDHKDAEDEDSELENSPEKQFASDMTAALDSLGEYFPEFDRLRELTKVTRISLIVLGLRKSLQEMSVREESVAAVLAADRQNRAGKISELVVVTRQNMTKISAQQGVDYRDCCNTVANELSKQLNIDTCDVSNALWRHDYKLFERLLLRGWPAKTADGVRREIQHAIENKRSEFSSWEARLRRRLSESLDQRRNRISECTWAPAVLSVNSDDTTRSVAYGGVLLTPKIHSEFRHDPQGFFSRLLQQRTANISVDALKGQKLPRVAPVTPLNPLTQTGETLGRKLPMMTKSGGFGMSSGGSGGSASGPGVGDGRGPSGSGSKGGGGSKGGDDFYLNKEGRWPHVFTDKLGHLLPRNAAEELQIRRKLVAIRDGGLTGRDPQVQDKSSTWLHPSAVRNGMRCFLFVDSSFPELRWWVKVEKSGLINSGGCNLVSPSGESGMGDIAALCRGRFTEERQFWAFLIQQRRKFRNIQKELPAHLKRYLSNIKRAEAQPKSGGTTYRPGMELDPEDF